MTNRVSILAIVALLAPLSTGTLAIENPGIRNPAGELTVPPSSLGGGLYNSPNPIDSSGNLVVTGNVARGRHFQASVPYDASTSFRASLGSTYLESFLRDSAGWEDVRWYSRDYGARPYYSPSATITTAQPGRSGVFSPSGTRVNDRASDVFGSEPSRTTRPPATSDPLDSDLASSSTTLTPQDIRRLVPGETGVGSRTQKLTAEQYRRQMGLLRGDLAGLSDATAESREDAVRKEDLLRLLPEPGLDPTRREAPYSELLTPQKERTTESGRTTRTERPERDSQTTLLSGDQPTVAGYDQFEGAEAGVLSQDELDLEQLDRKIADMKRQLRMSDAKASRTGTTETGRQASELLSTQGPAGFETGTRSLLQEVSALDTTEEGYPLEYQDETVAGAKSAAASTIEQVNSLSAAQLSAEAGRAMGPHKTLESFNQARFNKYINEARMYMKQGKYYRAAGAFDKAAIYDSKNPAAYAGKSLALFVAGEYISSTLFLTRALELESSEQYISSRVDLVDMLGDKAKFNSRMADIRDSLERTLSPQLEFLMAYNYYRLGELDKAEKAIDNVHKVKPSLKSVQILKKAIENAMRPAAEGVK